jgi:hypothetical protein
MTTATIVYGTPTAITITLASLASSATAGRESTMVDNASTLAVDYICGGKITTGTSPTASTPIYVYVYASYDGTSYGGGATGSDAALTPAGSVTLLYFVRAIYVTCTSNVTYTIPPFSVNQVCGGVTPVEWGIWVNQQTTVNLHATGGNHEFKYTSVKYASA